MGRLLPEIKIFLMAITLRMVWYAIENIPTGYCKRPQGTVDTQTHGDQRVSSTSHIPGPRSQSDMILLVQVSASSFQVRRLRGERQTSDLSLTLRSTPTAPKYPERRQETIAFIPDCYFPFPVREGRQGVWTPFQDFVLHPPSGTPLVPQTPGQRGRT